MEEEEGTSRRTALGGKRFVLFPFKTDYQVRKRKAKNNKLMPEWTMAWY